MARRLTKKQQGFITDVIKTGNATKAALNNYDIESDDKENVAGVIGSENLRKPKIREELDPIVDEMIAERSRLVKAMSTKNLDEVQYNHLVSSVDTLTKNIQLLSGKATERQGADQELTDLLRGFSNDKG